ncbi:MAG: hypothetical protein VB962_03300 [Pseudohongiellaceae bacterium]
MTQVRDTSANSALGTIDSFVAGVAYRDSVGLTLACLIAWLKPE